MEKAIFINLEINLIKNRHPIIKRRHCKWGETRDLKGNRIGFSQMENGDHLCAWRLDLNCTKLICNLPLSCQIGSDLKILGAVDMFPYFSIWNDKEMVVLIIISREFLVSKERLISNLTRLLLFFSKGYTRCSET